MMIRRYKYIKEMVYGVDAQVCGIGLAIDDVPHHQLTELIRRAGSKKQVLVAGFINQPETYIRKHFGI